MDAVARARRYLDLSNAHDLDAIFEMFAEDAVYESSNVGAHRGRAAIASMMREFFAARPDIRWEVDAIEPVGDDGAVFDFVAHSGGTTRRGRERLTFDADGLIRHVEVESA